MPCNFSFLDKFQREKIKGSEKRMLVAVKFWQLKHFLSGAIA